MRILHTADWHFGKTLEGRERYEEQKQFIEELCDICEREKVDLVLMAGDVYQTSNPSAAAEEVFYDAMVRLSANGTRGLVIIAGNHDNPDRIMAPAQLAARNGIVLLGRPNDLITPMTHNFSGRVQIVRGGASWTELHIPGSDHSAVITALPYPSESRLNKLLSESLDDLEQHKEYNNQLSYIFQQLAANYRSDTVNLAMSHLYVKGGEMSDSEYQIQVGGAYSVNPNVFPANAQYVALGHLHRSQEVNSSPVPTRYSGSPLAYSFSEAGQQKSVVLLDVKPGEAADIRILPLTSGKPLVRWTAKEGLPQVHAWLTEGRDTNAWIDLDVHMDVSMTPGDIQLLRKLHPGFVHIRAIYPEMENHLTAEEMRNLPLNELFIRFYERQTGGGTPDPELVELFLSLTEEHSEEGASNEPISVEVGEDNGEVAV